LCNYQKVWLNFIIFLCLTKQGPKQLEGRKSAHANIMGAGPSSNSRKSSREEDEYSDYQIPSWDLQ
jgi:hypothetical protein